MSRTRNTMGYLDALKIAVEAHEGQTDWEGLPYILHPVRVAEHAAILAVKFGTSARVARVVGLLHDVVEDTDVTAEDLVSMGLGSAELAVLLAVTRNDDEPYQHFIHRISQAGVAAMAVKLADLADNTDPARSRSIPATLELRYEEAQHVLHKRLTELGVM